jgi:hypothetical protein
VAAGLQSDVHRRPGGRLGAGGQGVSLGVRFAETLVIPLADDLPVLHDHRTHHGVGADESGALFRQGKGELHIVLIVHVSPPNINKNALNRSLGQERKIYARAAAASKCKKALKCHAFQSSLHAKRAAGATRRRFSSFIQTVLSALEFHQIMPCGSWALPPVGDFTLP